MSKKPAITVSELDLERLEKLLASQPNDKLEDELDRAKVVKPEKMPANVVSMNSTVQFRLSDSNEVFRKTLVYPKDAKTPDSISILAPIGSALLGLRIGDTMSWPAPDGKTLQVIIEDILYQPESAGQLHR